MSIIPEKLAEFFSAPSSAIEIFEIPANGAEVVALRPTEIRGAVINIQAVVGVREVQTPQTASHVGRLAQTESAPAPVAEVKMPTTPTATNSSADELMQHVQDLAKSGTDTAAELARTLQDA